MSSISIPHQKPRKRSAMSSDVKYLASSMPYFKENMFLVDFKLCYVPDYTSMSLFLLLIGQQTGQAHI